MVGDALESFDTDAPRHSAQGPSLCLRLTSVQAPQGSNYKYSYAS
jgi:hypothetical protein